MKTLTQQQKQDRKDARIARIRNRIPELDIIRAICILLMVFDHTMVSIGTAFYYSWRSSSIQTVSDLACFAYQYCAGRLHYPRYEWVYGLRELVHPYVVATFFILCGISCAFSRSNLRRGIRLAIVAAVYSGLSYLLTTLVPDMDDFLVVYGVLHMLATCILIWSLITLLCRNRAAATGIAFVLGCLVYFVLHPYISSLPSPDHDSILSIVHLNLTADGLREFSPGDYFPIIPNIAFFLWGVTIGNTVYRNKKALIPLPDLKCSRPILFIGRHTLEIYVLQAIVIAGVCALLTYFWISPGNWY